MDELRKQLSILENESRTLVKMAEQHHDEIQCMAISVYLDFKRKCIDFNNKINSYEEKE